MTKPNKKLAQLLPRWLALRALAEPVSGPKPQWGPPQEAYRDAATPEVILELLKQYETLVHTADLQNDFYEMTVKERNLARLQVERLKTEIAVLQGVAADRVARGT